MCFELVKLLFLFLFWVIIYVIVNRNYYNIAGNVCLLIMLQSKEEYEASVCLCGSQVCRGSYLNLTGEGAFQKVQA